MSKSSDKKSFILYADQREVIIDLTTEEKGKLLDALFDYIEDGVMPIFDDRALLVAFRMFKLSIDNNNLKYDEKCKKNAECVKKRWKKKNEDGEQKEYERIRTYKKDTNVSNEYERIKKIRTYKKDTNDTDNDNDNELQDTNVSMSNNNNLIILSDDMSHSDLVELSKVVFFFNSTLKKQGSTINSIRVIDGQRKKHVLARIREHGKEALVQVIEKAAGSDFLNGRNERGFIATFDWMVRPNNFIKILEGNYDNKENYGNNQRDYAAQQRANDVANLMQQLAARNKPVED